MKTDRLVEFLKDNPDKEIVILDGTDEAEIYEIWSSDKKVFISFAKPHGATHEDIN